MRRRWFLGDLTFLVIMIVLSTAPLAALTAWSLQSAPRALEAQAKDTLASAGQLAAGQVREDIINVQGQTSKLVSALARGARGSTSTTLSQAAAGLPDFFSQIFVVRADGTIVDSVPTDTNRVWSGSDLTGSPAFPDQPWFRRALSGSEGTISDVLRHADPDNGGHQTPALAFARRVTMPGTASPPVVVCFLDLYRYQDMFADYRLPPGAVATLVDSRRVIIANTTDDRLSLTSRNGAMFDDPALPTGSVGASSTRTEEGNGGLLNAYVPLAPFPWTMVVSTPVATAYDNATRLQSSLRAIAITLGLLSLVGLACATIVHLRTRAIQRAIARLALSDPLTGLNNRRAWSEALTLELARSRRSGRPVCILLMDIDHFKKYNDSRGHVEGDRLLVGAGRAWRGQLRAADMIARWGGEEFIVLLREGAAQGGKLAADRLRQVVPDGQTVSIGVAAWDGTESDADLIARADGALYEAKKTRNCTVIADSASSHDAVLGPSGANS